MFNTLTLQHSESKTINNPITLIDNFSKPRYRPKSLSAIIIINYTYVDSELQCFTYQTVYAKYFILIDQSIMFNGNLLTIRKYGSR